MKKSEQSFWITSVWVSIASIIGIVLSLVYADTIDELFDKLLKMFL